MSEDLHKYVREQTQPTALDVEAAKRVILEQVDDATSPSADLIEWVWNALTRRKGTCSNAGSHSSIV